MLGLNVPVVALVMPGPVHWPVPPPAPPVTVADKVWVGALAARQISATAAILMLKAGQAAAAQMKVALLGPHTVLP